MTSAPMALAILTAMWPSPPSPTTPTESPSSTSKYRSGEKVVIPAHSSGAAAAGSRPFGDAKHKAAVHYYRRRIAALGDGASVPGVGSTVRAGVAAFTILFQSVEAALTFAAGVHHATDAHAVSGSEVLDGGTDTRHASDNLVPRNQGVRRHTPFGADRVHVGVAKSAELDGDLDVVFFRGAPGHRQRNESAIWRRCSVGRSERLCARGRTPLVSTVMGLARGGGTGRPGVMLRRYSCG